MLLDERLLLWVNAQRDSRPGISNIKDGPLRSSAPQENGEKLMAGGPEGPQPFGGAPLAPPTTLGSKDPILLMAGGPPPFGGGALQPRWEGIFDPLPKRHFKSKKF